MESSKRDALVEVIADALKTPYYSRKPNAAPREIALERAEDALSAALTAIETEECGECGGTGEGDPYPNPTDRGTEWLRQPCEVCHGTKQAPGKPLVIGVLEEMGVLQEAATMWRYADEQHLWSFDVAKPSGVDGIVDVPLYWIREHSQETP